MGRKIFTVVFVVIVLLGAFYWYRTTKAQDGMASGEVYQDNTTTPHSGAYSQPNAAATANVPATSTTSNQPPGGAPTPPEDTTTAAQPAAAGMPTKDTITANPPNGMAFTGTGRYQWYRQGNLTWRVDSQSGATCVAFATDDEWRKPRVYQSGCGRD